MLKFTPKGTKPTRALRFYIWSGGVFMDWLQNMQSLKKLGLLTCGFFPKVSARATVQAKERVRRLF